MARLLHVYLFDSAGSRESVDIAHELVRLQLPDVRVLAVNAASVRKQMLRHGRLPLVPSVVTVNLQTGEWAEVYTHDYLVTHFLDPLRAAVAAPDLQPPPRELSVAEMAQQMMDERDKEALQSRRQQYRH
jgi:hypothetical protein